MGLSQFDEHTPFARENNLPLDAGADTVGCASGTNQVVRVDALYLGNTDSVPRLVQLNYVDSGGGTGPLTVVTVPAGAGQTVPTVEVLSSLLPPNQQGIVLGVNCALMMATAGGGGAGTVITSLALGGVL